jgi:hypothetical protein
VWVEQAARLIVPESLGVDPDSIDVTVESWPSSSP